jgi:catechol 2,3-dioxygenase-like lactoylglutathione lyase family enzyme
MTRIFDHVDLRVRDLAACEAFYRTLLPRLGFTLRVEIEGWLQFEGGGPGASEFFGVTEDPEHRPNRSRIAFWAVSKAKVDELARMLSQIGATAIEGPDFESPTYYAVYFNDPSGNPLEICFRSRKFTGLTA